MGTDHSERKVTIKEVAELAGTSKTTVSFYLNGKLDRMSDETAERIRKVIEETHYQPSMAARSLNAKESKLIGVIIGDITNTFSNQVVKGIGSIAAPKGYQMLVGNSDYNRQSEATYIDKMLAVGVDGFIVQPTARFHGLLARIEDTGKPIVFFDSKLYDPTNSWVKTNNYEATYDAVSRCLDRGYERALVISADPKLLSTRIERFSGFVDAVEDKGAPHESLMFEGDSLDSSEVREFLTKELVPGARTLVFVPNCWALPSVFTAMKALGCVMPDPVGLLSFDNTEWCEFSSPTVSTIVQPTFEEGQEACRILLDQIEGTNALERNRVLGCSVRWLESTL